MATYLEAIISVLVDAGKPLNYREIARRALERGLIPKTESLTSNVSKIITTHLAPPNQTFVKVRRGVYDLSPNYRTGGLTKPRTRKNRTHRKDSSQSIEGMAPSTAYSEYLYKTKYGTLVYGEINDNINFMFCEKDSKLLNFGLKDDVSSALYALLDIETNNVYVGITRRGSKRITDHWKDKFTHVVILFSKSAWSTDLRTKLELDLTEFFRSLPWNPTNRTSDIALEPNEMRTRAEILPSLRQITARIHSLIHNMDSLYPGHAHQKQPKKGNGKKLGRKVDGTNPPPLSDTTVRNFWIWPCPKDSYQTVRREGIWASQAALVKIGARVRHGDRVAFYVKEHKAFCDVHEFVGEWYRATHAVWPGEAESGGILYPSQIRLRQIMDGRAALGAMNQRLEIFLKNVSGNPGHILRSTSGYPGNHGRPIPESDMKIISDSMRPVGASRD